MAIITLTTDFGDRDGYVAAMKGVILRIAPTATLIDATHHVERHRIVHGAYILRQLVEWYPPVTIHVVVVDPGVGTARRIVAARARSQLVVAPDNGLLSLLHHDRLIAEAHVVQNPAFMLPEVSSTFHGRDVMAPTAGRLAAGAALADVGPATDHVEVLRLARPERQAGGAVHGCIVHRDAFGNLITNLSAADIAHLHRAGPGPHVVLDGHDLGPLRRTYAEVAAGEPLALIGSDNRIEIAVNTGSAAEHFNLGPDALVVVH